MQRVHLRKALRKRGVWVRPRAKVNKFAANLLGPHAGIVWEEREVRVGLARLDGFGRLVRASEISHLHHGAPNQQGDS